MTRRRAVWERLDVTRAQSDWAVNRTDFLMDSIGAELSLKNLLANAYLQGVIDAAELMAQRKKPPPPTPKG